MNKLLVVFALGWVVCSNFSNAQQWKVNENKLFSKNEVIIGDSTDVENSKLTVISDYNIEGGGGYGILSRHSTNNQYLNFNSKSRIGYSSLWSSQAQSAAFAGALYLNKDNASGMDSRSAGGLFILEFDNYAPYNSSSYTHYLSGSYSTIRGNIAYYPDNSIISAVIGEDQFSDINTYAGYFLGKGYFSDNVGFGTDQPSTKIEVADGDIYISDINKGIIMKSPDGNCWRGVLDNSGNLTFSSTTCPDEPITNSNIESAQKEVKKVDIVVYPNPTTKYINIDVNINNSEELKYFLYDVNGVLFDSKNIDKSTTVINIKKCKTGMYLLKILNSSGEEVSIKKIIKE